MSEPMTNGGDTDPVRFDHVALVVRRPTDLWPMMAGAFGGRFLDRGNAAGYGWTQLRFANGFVVEGIHPEGDVRSEFLERFLNRSGVGPHHLTFKVDDLAAVTEQLRSIGIRTVGENQHDPHWLESFIHPDDAHGVVVQLAEVSAGGPGPAEQPEGFPELPFEQPVASLGRVVHAVRDLSAAVSLFCDGLGGHVVSTGSAVDGNHWTELGWGGPGRLRLLEATHAKIADWIGDRPGRMRHLFFNYDEPSHIPGATKVAEGRWVVEADDVLGTRFVIASSAR